jgi:hypothetical protein
MVAHRMSGDIAPLNFKLGTIWLRVMRPSALATTAGEEALVFIELEAGWVLELGWMCRRQDSSLAPSKI